MNLYWYKETEASNPVLYPTFYTPEQAANAFKDKHSYGILKVFQFSQGFE